MANLPLPSFPEDAAPRAFWLGQLYQNASKIDVARIVVEAGIPSGDFNLYWDTRVPTGAQHQGHCFVECRSRDQAVLAWARLNGQQRWNRTLRVNSLKHRGALRPTLDELYAATQPQPQPHPQPSGSAGPPPRAPAPSSRAPAPRRRSASPPRAPSPQPKREPELTPPLPEEPDYYADLGLPGRVDDLQVIWDQYKERTRAINDAFELLMDPERKAAYDARRDSNP